MRQLRAPLAAGLLWLLVVWLVVEPRVPSSGEVAAEPWDTFDDIRDAFSGLGVGLTAATVSFVAYLLGSLSENLWKALPGRLLGNLRVEWESPAMRQRRQELSHASRGQRLRARLRDLSPFGISVGPMRSSEGLPWEPSPWFPPPGEPVLPSVRAFEKLESVAREWLKAAHVDNDPGLRTTGEANQPAVMEYQVDALRFDGPGLWGSYRMPVAEVVARVVSELDLVESRLIGKDTEFFGVVDRVRSESELRLTLLPPLTSLMVVLAWRSSLLWLTGLVFAYLLLKDGVRRVAAITQSSPELITEIPHP